MALSKVLRVALVGMGLSAMSAPSQAFYTGFDIFGDSLSDVGNVYQATGGAIPAPPYSDGRFSNGPIWVDDLASALQLPAPAPSGSGGTDYAYGTATATSGGPNMSPFPTAGEQVGLFLLPRGAAPSTDLYSMWFGANDVLNALGANLNTSDAHAFLAASAQAETNAIEALAAAGARDILVGLVPDISVTPLYNSAPSDTRATAKALAQYYNTQLLMDLVPETRLINIYELDTFTLLDDAVADPAKYGVSNVTDPCYAGTYAGGGSGCTGSDSYLFWDHLHPTEKGHEAVAALALAALAAGPLVAPVPLPSSAPMFGAGLLLVALAGYGLKCRRKAAAQAIG